MGSLRHRVGRWGLEQVGGSGRVGSNLPSASIHSLWLLASLEDMALPWAAPPGLQEGDGVWGEPCKAAPTQNCCCYQTSGRWLHAQKRVHWLVLEGRCDRKGLELCLLASVQTPNTFKICQIRKQTRITTWIGLPNWNASQQRLSCREKSDGIRPYKTWVQVPGNGYKLSLTEHLYVL